ncbi:uncharacterized protein LOC126279026 [Schistocerca gregaria]|uniref:uncharacterized protein LOC126279026 n=1 Tax=Schistocerca gregaria TaxID=7010 RepID=UPI00211E0F9A|nr:uncharacterized protein LOC126279026 [Schistocerca gregaria]
MLCPRQQNHREQLVHSYKNGDWRNILSLLNVDHGECTSCFRHLLWVQPTEEDLLFIGKTMKDENIPLIVSVGCGTGLLEWLITNATGLAVIGVEVDRAWWESPYAPPTFIPLRFVKDDDELTKLPKEHALLFCYFNNNTAFYDYLKVYEGGWLIIIGPTIGSGRHSKPAPFDKDFQDVGWKLQTFKEIGHTKDYIAIYKRSGITVL